MFWSPTQLLIQGQWWSKRATHLPQPVLALAVVVQAVQTWSTWHFLQQLY